MVESTPDEPSSGSRRAATFVGVVLAMSFFALSQTPEGLQYDFHGPWNRIPAAELQFWLGHFLLFLPGMALVGWGLWPERWPSIRDAANAVSGWSDATFLKIVGGATLVWIGVAALGHQLLLRGFPVTDDEYSLRFGGQLLASGRTWIEAPPLIESLPNAYLYLWDDRLASFDWLGSQLAWALAELAGFEWPWPLMAAVPLICCGWVARREVGRGYGVATVLLLLLSPMFVSLSFTTHAHLLSRGFVAAFLAIWVVAIDRDRLGWWVAAGAMVAAGALCRPFETAAILSPFAILTAWSFVRGEEWARKAVAGMALPLVVSLGGWLVHQWSISGTWGSSLRSPDTPNELPWRIISIPMSATFTDPEQLWSRFGGNFAYNILMLIVFFGGPIGAALALLGARASRFAKLLAIGIVVQLLLALFHDDAGIHSVGPIHYSEVAPFAAILAAYGVREVVGWVRRHNLPMGPIFTPVVAAYTIGMLFFSMWLLFGLRRQADVQASVWAVVERAELETEAAIVSPEFHKIFKHHPEWNKTAAWVLQWPPPRPGTGDDPLFIHPGPTPHELTSAFPDRTFYELKLIDRDPWVKVVPLDSSDDRARPR